MNRAEVPARSEKEGDAAGAATSSAAGASVAGGAVLIRVVAAPAALGRDARAGPGDPVRGAVALDAVACEPRRAEQPAVVAEHGLADRALPIGGAVGLEVDERRAGARAVEH